MFASGSEKSLASLFQAAAARNDDNNNKTFKFGLCNMAFLDTYEIYPPWNWDWRDFTIPSPEGNYSVVGPVKDQGVCGSW